MTPTKRYVIIAVALGLIIIAGLVYWNFNSARTRLTAEALVPVPQPPGSLPHAPKHIVIVIEENKDFDDIIGSAKAPYVNQLARDAAVFTHAYGVAHPSQPNYFALFAGVTDREGDGCTIGDIAPDAPNVASELQRAHQSFTGYAESLPNDGFAGCKAGRYARKHAPWTHFTSVDAAHSLPFTALRSYDTLPTLAWIVPNLDNDMHDGSIQRADAWLRTHIDPLVQWAKKNDTLVIITWDESDAPVANHIPLLFVGPMVRPGRYDAPTSHYNVLRTIEAFYGLAPLGATTTATPITGVWN